MELRKAQRMAHIVPVGCLEKTANNQYHMCLAHLVKKSDKYASFYKRMVDEGKFVLMDNGAAEGEQLSVPELIECYEIVHPTEVVLPDTLLDKDDTLKKGEATYNVLMEYYDYHLPFKLMAVPQGRTSQEWYKCMVEMLNWTFVETIGVSKFLQMETGEKWIRRLAVSAICDQMQVRDFCSVKEIHLLGCSESTDVIRNIFNSFDIVRGCDSAFVYLMSQSGNVWREGYGEVERPEGEIDFLGGCDYNSLETNMDYFNHMVGIANNGTDVTWNKQEVQDV